MSTLLYFAYGSNMSTRRLQARVPSASVKQVATLSGHQLRYHKKSHDGSAKCDAFETGDSADQVIGVLFTLSSEEKPSLDYVEGLGAGYDIKPVDIIDPAGNTHQAYTYYATDIEEGLLPYAWYRQHVLIGAKENDLPAAYIDDFLAVTAQEDPDNDRHQREMAIYR